MAVRPAEIFMIVTLAALRVAPAPEITFIREPENCPGLSDETCGPEYHFPFDDATNTDHVCGRPDSMTIAQEGWSSPGGWSALGVAPGLTQNTPGYSAGNIKRIPGISGSALYLDGTEKRPLQLEIPGSECLAGVESCPEGFTFAFWIKPSFDRREDMTAPGLRATTKSSDVIIAVNVGENGKLGSFVIRTKRHRKGRALDAVLFSLTTVRTTFYRGRSTGTLLKHQIKIRRSLIPDQMWTHVTVRWNLSTTRRNERLIAYINREKAKAKIDTNRKRIGKRAFQGKSPVVKMYIGSYGVNSIARPGAKLAMDELQIWQRPLSKEEISTLPIHPGCPACWRQYKGRCFKFFGEPKIFADAATECKTHAGGLATVVDEGDVDAIAGLLTPKGSAPAWIDGDGVEDNEALQISTFHDNAFAQYDYPVSQRYSVRDEEKEAPFRSKPDTYIGAGWAGLFQYDTSEQISNNTNKDDVKRPYRDDDASEVPTVDLGDDDYADIDRSSYEYVLDDQSIVNIAGRPPAICYVVVPEHRTLIEEKCWRISPYICEIGINECQENHACGDHPCIDQRSGYTCKCPENAKWNGEVCQGTRNKDDYCSMVTMFSRLLPNGFCSRPHFQAVCPRECESFAIKENRFKR